MINFDGINISYQQKEILKEANLEVKKGEFYCFIGRNGSGKTSFFNYLKSNKSNKLRIRMLKQNQCIDSAYGIAIWDFLKSYCIFEKIFQWEKSLIFYLKKFDLYEKRFQLIDSMSGGEKQRMFLSQILLGKSELILLDESFSNLDIEHKIEYYDLFKNEAKNRHIPIILIEHDLRLALELSENIIFCITRNMLLKCYSSVSEELSDMINQEFRIAITDENKYTRLIEYNQNITKK